VVLDGDLRELKASSPDRFLRVDVAVDPGWLDATAEIAAVTASGTRLRLAPHADPAAVLDAVRAHVPVRDFGVETPSLSELFLQAAGHDAADDADVDADAAAAAGVTTAATGTDGPVDGPRAVTEREPAR
jgi:ABC-2 type transport system ATP-binding protein